MKQMRIEEIAAHVQRYLYDLLLNEDDFPVKMIDSTATLVARHTARVINMALDS